MSVYLKGDDHNVFTNFWLEYPEIISLQKSSKEFRKESSMAKSLPYRKEYDKNKSLFSTTQACSLSYVSLWYHKIIFSVK